MDVDDLDMQNNGHVNNETKKNAQFDTVRTCRNITARTTTLSMNRREAPSNEEMHDLSNRDIDHLVKQLGKQCGRTKSLDHGNLPRYHEGNLHDLHSRASTTVYTCNWGHSTVRSFLHSVLHGTCRFTQRACQHQREDITPRNDTSASYQKTYRKEQHISKTSHCRSRQRAQRTRKAHTTAAVDDERRHDKKSRKEPTSRSVAHQHVEHKEIEEAARLTHEHVATVRNEDTEQDCQRHGAQPPSSRCRAASDCARRKASVASS